MSRFAILVLCACLIQVALGGQISYESCGLGGLEKISVSKSSGGSSSYGGSYGSVSKSSGGSSSYGGSYGGVGTGQVSASGDIEASGKTVVVGSVPVLSAVKFSGKTPAKGSVSISGKCECGCN